MEIIVESTYNLGSWRAILPLKSKRNKEIIVERVTLMRDDIIQLDSHFNGSFTIAGSFDLKGIQPTTLSETRFDELLYSFKLFDQELIPEILTSFMFLYLGLTTSHVVVSFVGGALLLMIFLSLFLR